MYIYTTTPMAEYVPFINPDTEHNTFYTLISDNGLLL